jgi:lipopolysaccharide/colanic/teichoic acid biosynthesis glycosyltransferase
MYRLTKRLFDSAVSLCVIIPLLPVLLVIGVCIRVTMGAPVFFRQQRPGLHGRPFNLIKFRTMNVPAPGEDAAATDAVRLTRLGRTLRALSLDELPTLFNVLNGSMSLVGPRPLLMQYLERYTPEQFRRHEVLPGVTGWAQVNGRNAISWEEKFRPDVWYVDNCSFALDFKILWMTALSVLKREGISHAGEATMPEFMGTKGVDHDR